MTIQFRWSEADFVSAQWTWIKNHPWKLVLGFWYPIAILILAIAIFATNPNPGKWVNFLPILLIVAGIVGFALLLQRWRWHRQFKRTPLWRDEVLATVDGQSIRLKGQTFESTQYWGQFS